MKKDCTIAVIGLGLIGASILKGLRNKCYKLIGVTRSPKLLKKLWLQILADECSTDLSIIKDADVVFICTPINKIIEKIDEVRKIVRPDCIITDVASLKGFIMDHINKLAFL